MKFQVRFAGQDSMFANDPFFIFSAPNEVVERVACLLEATSSSGKLEGTSIYIERRMIMEADLDQLLKRTF